ncbi:hypothetical protein [Methylorubrum populi]|uniref:Uncharacterized protein n=1 Tax=Methylorubrum populi TaxID=223967 RepID=A0A833JAK8_9HYPH|nr:hypothetical protein [Methylorubrum populi]KAB7788059.1 hypothetical protein F8B43_0064 [Methylorubrum populi]
MPEQVLKARVLVNGVPAEVGLTGLLAGTLPGVPFVRKGVATTLGDALTNPVAGTDDVPGLASALTGKLDRAVLVKASAPVAADIPAGTIRVAKNTATGRISLFVNDGGSIVDLINGQEF